MQSNASLSFLTVISATLPLDNLIVHNLLRRRMVRNFLSFVREVDNKAHDSKSLAISGMFEACDIR